MNGDEFGDALAEIGRYVVESSRQPEATERGLVSQLFPYIYEAAKRISARAISREFKNRGVKISQVSISKALREKKKYFQAHFDHVEVAARTVERVLGSPASDLLSDEGTFVSAELQTDRNEYDPDDEWSLQDALSVLRDDWWGFAADFRETCLAFGRLEDEEDEESE